MWTQNIYILLSLPCSAYFHAWITTFIAVLRLISPVYTDITRYLLFSKFSPAAGLRKPNWSLEGGTESMRANLPARDAQGLWHRSSHSAGWGPVSNLLPGERLKLMAWDTVPQIPSSSPSSAKSVLMPHTALRSKGNTSLCICMCLFSET